ncbi:MAG TPA: hypothetical protein V6D04_00845 [Candidatus Obscuribacterales bacterium]
MPGICRSATYSSGNLASLALIWQFIWQLLSSAWSQKRDRPLCQLIRNLIPAKLFTLESVLTDFVTISSKLTIATPGIVILERYNNLADIG